MRLRNSGAVFFLSYDPARAATARYAHLAEDQVRAVADLAVGSIAAALASRPE